MLINLSNHPSKSWSTVQLLTASHYGELVDIPFPQIAPEATAEQIDELALKYLEQIREIKQCDTELIIVHIAGELSFCYAMITLLKECGYTVVTSTTRRIIEQVDNKTIIKRFEFNQFRKI